MDIDETIQISCSRDVARYFIFLHKGKNLNFGEIRFKNISAKSLYGNNRDIFDKFFNIAQKYHIDIKKYVNFYVFKLGKNEYSIPTDFLNINTLNLYCNNMKVIEQYEKLYSYFQKSVDHIVSVCLEKNYPNVKEYLKRLILKNTLAEKVLAGEISEYYLATIPNIKQLILKMNQINQDELSTLYQRTEEMNKSMQDAFMYMKSQQVNPISYTNSVLHEKLSALSAV